MIETAMSATNEGTESVLTSRDTILYSTSRLPLPFRTLSCSFSYIASSHYVALFACACLTIPKQISVSTSPTRRQTSPTSTKTMNPSPSSPPTASSQQCWPTHLLTLLLSSQISILCSYYTVCKTASFSKLPPLVFVD